MLPEPVPDVLEPVLDVLEPVLDVPEQAASAKDAMPVPARAAPSDSCDSLQFGAASLQLLLLIAHIVLCSLSIATGTEGSGRCHPIEPAALPLSFRKVAVNHRHGIVMTRLGADEGISAGK